jgi:hypothetical protein
MIVLPLIIRLLIILLSFSYFSHHTTSASLDFEIIFISVPLCNAVLQFHPVLVENEYICRKLSPIQFLTKYDKTDLAVVLPVIPDLA